MRSNDVIQIPGLEWQRASLCQTGECVEISAYNDLIVMRNSSQPHLGYVYFTPKEFRVFLENAKAGEFG